MDFVQIYSFQNQKHILLIGYSRAAEQYIDRIKANPEWGYIVRGILADNVPRGTEYKGVKVLGRIDNLTRKKQHQRDVSYLVSMLDFQDENAKNKVKRLRR